MSDVISYDPNEEIHNRSKQVRRQSHIKQLTKLHGKVEIHEIQAAFEAQEWQTMRSLLLRLQKPYQNKPKKGPPPKSPGRRDRGDVARDLICFVATDILHTRVAGGIQPWTLYSGACSKVTLEGYLPPTWVHLGQSASWSIGCVLDCRRQRRNETG